MSKSNAFETSLLEHIFQNADIANIGDASGLLQSATAGSLYVSLYTSDPGEGSGGTEAAYGSYARVAVARSGAGWDVTGPVASNVAEIAFPQCSSGSETLTHFAIMTASSSGTMLFHGTLSASLAVSAGITPTIAIGQLTITED